MFFRISRRKIMHVIKDRVTATRDEPFCLFLIGMRINNFWKIHKWLPIFFQMPKMMKELENDKSLGYLGGESWFGRNIISVQYWESFEHLENFAKSRDHSHLPAWQKFLKNVGVNGDVGIWHETYEIKKGSYENIYANMPPFLLGKVANLTKVTSSNNSARKRKS